MSYRERIDTLLKDVNKIYMDPSRKKLIADSIEQKCCVVLQTGTLATWTPVHSTGRSPKDTYIVKRPESEDTIDWTSPNCIPMEPSTFDMIFDDAVHLLAAKQHLYVLHRVVGADSSYALPIMTVTDDPLSGLFVDNMFRPVPQDIHKSIYADKPFLLVSVPWDYLDTARYQGRLRSVGDGRTSEIAVVADFDKRVGIVFGSAYMGSLKKLIFTVMNYYLPADGILPLHCSANEGPNGDCACLLGLSGTGKTTLSADPERALLGDDEHGWNDNGIANFEYGCYAKLINLNPAKEPDIYRATFHVDHYLDHGAIVENVMVYPDGTMDLNDERFTPNSRSSYPLRYNANIKESAVSGHPRTILFLTADAYGVLPPVTKLTTEQAMLWFIMGYTSKLAGTETGVVEPQATFSRFFGEPFMPRRPSDYSDLLGKKMQQHHVPVYLINTGWSGGAYGVGSRMDINLTRAMVRAALNGDLEKVEYELDPVFKVQTPQSCPGVPDDLLHPINTWTDKGAFKANAEKLAAKFAAHFDKNFKGKVDARIEAACPGKPS
ncbi:phosphoenolpyruvate carboxykinase (ATP) [candidate division KSB1 bacterium]|nr:phosphoenolpyruvate carboxykinase (ATP) [candidate division KSB1 bacterium]RQW08637.1 MAG: phosphoenolpyruvate carboxykinase (ATP) [candidate division KSB1 bacterium]